jgi:hypothetical protein
MDPSEGDVVYKSHVAEGRRPVREGCFDYWRQGVVVARERWRQESLPCGGTRTHCTRDAGLFGLLLEAQVDTTALGQECLFTLAGKGQRIEAHYRQTASGILWRNALETAWQRVDAPSTTHCFALMRVFTGAMVLALHAQGGVGTVVTPSLATLEDASSVFRPLTSTRSVTRAGDGSGQWLLSGGPYEQPARITLDPEGQLIAYDWAGPDGVVWSCVAAHPAA